MNIQEAKNKYKEPLILTHISGYTTKIIGNTDENHYKIFKIMVEFFRQNCIDNVRDLLEIWAYDIETSQKTTYTYTFRSSFFKVSFNTNDYNTDFHLLNYSDKIVISRLIINDLLQGILDNIYKLKKNNRKNNIFTQIFSFFQNIFISNNKKENSLGRIRLITIEEINESNNKFSEAVNKLNYNNYFKTKEEYNKFVKKSDIEIIH